MLKKTLAILNNHISIPTTGSWDISTAVYANKSVDVSSYTTRTWGLQFSPDGLNMYFCNDETNHLFQYSLSKAWDVSTGVYSKTFNASNQVTDSADGLQFSSDGTKMYILGQGDRKIFQYSLSTAWDISTASYTSKYFLVSGYSDPRGIFLSSDGLKLYLSDNYSGSISRFSLSTAWDISTASYLNDSYVAGGGTIDLQFSPDGTNLYTMAGGTKVIYQYILSTAWDITSYGLAPNYSHYFLANGQESSVESFFVATNGLNLYITGSSPSTVFEYTLT